MVDIDSVIVWNRTDCCSDRLSDFYVFASETPFATKALDATRSQAGVVSRFHSGAAGVTEEFPVGARGRYVRVQLASDSQFLSLKEVQVMAVELPVPLVVQPLTATPVAAGGDLTLLADAVGSGALQYKWNFGDGTAETSYSSAAGITHRYH